MKTKSETKQEENILVPLKEYRFLLGLYNSTKTLLDYQEMQKETPIWEDRINKSSERVKSYVKELDTFNEELREKNKSLFPIKEETALETNRLQS